MNKLVLGLMLGAVLGAIDGLTALFSGGPDVKAQIGAIIIGSTGKGLLVGIIAGWYANRVQSVSKGVMVGLVVAAILAAAVAAIPQPDGSHYWLEIIIPGSIVGIIVGYATQKYGAVRRRA